MTLQATDVQAIGSELAIRWGDDSESYLGLEMLRRQCPCAACGGEPDVMGNVERPTVHHSALSFQLRELRRVGGYAIQPVWADGHDTGLYTFPYLQRLAAIPTP